MELLREIKRLSHTDKLKVMEALWKDLSSDEEKYDSPAWHENALKETETRMNNGVEEIVDWGIAKKNLRKKFE
ncbi:MAG: addiction module protein [Candidatus Brocadiaceae bacterium]|nr:addiction module protein [Candidatus Brocadiaceae bacterium]